MDSPKDPTPRKGSIDTSSIHTHRSGAHGIAGKTVLGSSSVSQPIQPLSPTPSPIHFRSTQQLLPRARSTSLHAPRPSIAQDSLEPTGTTHEGAVHESEPVRSVFRFPVSAASTTSIHYILEQLFSRFVSSAEGKLHYLVPYQLDGNPNLLTPLRVGQDPSFDRLLTSLASVARHCPKIVIDAIMSWRNYKNDTPFQITSNLSVSYSHIKQRDLEILLAERKTLILNFIICRVLITIMGSLTKELLPESLGEKLEAMVFEQIKIADPEIISRNPNRQSNIDFFAELLGSISNLRFGSVSDHFASELARSSSLKESKLEMIIRQMRHLRLKIVPMEAIEDSAFFLETCAKYFQATGASRIQLAFADTFVELLEPIVEVVTGVINIPAWIKAIESIYGKAYRPNQRLKGTLSHLFLVTTLLSACKKSFFYDNWMSAANMCLQRLSQRDYKNKLSVLFCLVRLIWIYLYRFPETPVHNAHMNLETIVRILLPSLPGRKPNAVSTTLFSTEIGPPSAMINMGPLSVSGIGGLDLYVQIAYVICLKHQEYGIENLLLPLLGADASTSSGGSSGLPGTPGTVSGFSGYTLTDASSSAYPGSSLGSAEEYPGSGADVSLYPDRFIIAIRTMRLLLADFEEHLGTDERSVFYNNPAAGGFSHNVVLESRINIPPPRFPAFNQFFNIQLGTTESLRAIRERKDPQASPGEIDLDSAQARGPELSKLLSASLPNHVYNGIGTMLQQTYNKINDILGRAWVEFDSGSSFDSAVGLHLLGDLATSGLHRDGSSSNLGAFAASKSSISGSGSGSGAAAEGAFSGASSDKYERPGLFVGDVVTSSTGLTSGRDKLVLYELMRACLDAIPRFVPTGVGPVKIIENLGRWMVHVDEDIRKAAFEALMRIAMIKDGGLKGQWALKGGETLLSGILRIAVDTSIGIVNEKFGELATMQGTHDAVYSIMEKVVCNYICFLKLYLEEMKELHGREDSRLEPAHVDWIVQGIESKGLLFLTSTFPAIRKHAIGILEIAVTIENVLKYGSASATDDARKARQSNANDDKVRVHPHSQSQPAQLTPKESRAIRVLQTMGDEIVRKYEYDPLSNPRSGSDGAGIDPGRGAVDRSPTLLAVAGSAAPVDVSLWNRCFAAVVAMFYDYLCPSVVIRTFADINVRLGALYPTISSGLDLSFKLTSNGTLQWNTVSTPSNLAQVPSRAVLPSDEIVVQFQLYLTFVVATMEVVSSESIGHIGKLSPGNDCHHNVYPVFGSRVLRWEVDDTIWRRPVAVRIEQPQSIIHKAFSLILSDRVHIRNASIIAFGSMHWRTYRTFLEEIRPCGKLVMDDIRQRIATNPQTPSHSTRKLSLSSASQHTRKLDRLREELTQIFSLIAHFVDHDEYRQDHELVAPVLQYIKDMQRFLHHPEIQSDLDYQMLRYYFCGFIERFFDHLVTSLDVAMDVAMDASGNRLSDEKLENYISIDQRYALFLMFEQWCGHGPLAASIREHEDKTIKALLDGIRDQRDRAMTHDRIELQRNALELASLKAMSSLCRGSITNARHPRVSFDVRTLLAWVDGLLTSSNDKHHAIARVALENLLLYNRSNEELFENVLLRCHSSTVPHDVQRGYFMAMVNLFGSPAQNHFYTTSQRKYLRERKLNDLPFHPAKLLCLAMYMIGSHSLQIRKAAIRLLLGVEGLMGDSAPAYPPDVKGYTMYPGGPGESAYAQPLDLGDDEEDATNEAAAITSALPAIFKRAQAAVSCRLASEYTEITYEMLSEMIIQTEMIRKGGPPTYYNPNLRDIFIAMLPWIRNIDLPNVMNDVENMKETPVPPKSLAKVTSEVILTNLLYITIRYGDDFINEIEDIWAQLVDRFEEDAPYADNQTAPAGAAASALSYEKMSRNVQMIVEFLLDVGVQRRSRKFVKYAKKIVVYLGRTAGCEQLVETLMSWITPKGLVPSSGDRNLGGIDDDISEMLSFGKSGREVGGTYIQGVGPNPLFMVDLGDVLNDSQLPRQFSRGQLSCVLLVDLAIECGHNVLESRLPTLLLVIFVQLDHPLTLIVEESRLLLINLIHSILPRDQNADRIDAIHSTLNLKEGKRLWNYEDVSPKIPAIDSERQMAGLLSDVLALFSSVDPQIKQHLGETALQWGARRTLRHVAARSLQIFRALLPPFSLKMIGELLYRLHCTIGSPVDEYQGYSLELLNTLQVMIDTLDPARLLLYPQLFWAAVACMQSPNEFEFIRGVHMLNKITGKIGIEEEQCRNILILSLPGNWRGQFHGLQPLLARGLCSSVAETEAVEVLGHLLTFADDALVDQPSERVLRSILCFLPRLLQGLEAAPQADGGADVNISVEGCLRVASLLGMMADRKGHFGLGKLFLSYSKQRFRSKEDFLSQLVSLIRNEFCPTHEGMVLQTLLKHLTNRHPFYRKRTLKFLKSFLSTTKLEHSGLPAEELLEPLVMLLQSDFVCEALEVLDVIALEACKNLPPDFNAHFITGIKSKIDLIAGDHAAIPIDGARMFVQNSGWTIRGREEMTSVCTHNLNALSVSCRGTQEHIRSLVVSHAKKLSASIDASAPKKPSPLTKGRYFSLSRGNPEPSSVGASLVELESTPKDIVQALTELDAYFGMDDSRQAHGAPPDAKHGILNKGIVWSPASSLSAGQAHPAQDYWMDGLLARLQAFDGSRPNGTIAQDRWATNRSALQLLTHGSARVLVRLRFVDRASGDYKGDESMYWIRSDVSKIIGLPVDLILVHRLEHKHSSQMYVSVHIKARDGIESAAWAEELCELLRLRRTVDANTPAAHEVMLSQLDPSWKPEITIELLGLKIPYIPMGLRAHLPHAQAPPSLDDPGSKMPVGARPLENSADTAPVNNVHVELLTVFPAAFQLSLHRIEELMKFGSACYRALMGRWPSELSQLLESLDSVHKKQTEIYTPVICDVSLEAITPAAQYMAEVERANPLKYDKFCRSREECIRIFNEHVEAHSTCFTELAILLDPHVLQSTEMGILVVRMIDAACGVLRVHLSGLYIQQVLEEFLGIQKSPLKQEIEATKTCLSTWSKRVEMH